MRLDYTSIRNNARAMRNCAEMGLGVERVRLVVNGYGQRRQLTAGQVEEALGMKILHYIPNDPASVNQAINKRIPVRPPSAFGEGLQGDPPRGGQRERPGLPQDSSS